MTGRRAIGGDGALGVVWRGPLISCNYACCYCPFAKRVATPRRLASDRAALARFAAWVESATFELDLLFTPYGEALIWPWYRDTLPRLATLPHVRRVSVQTNGSSRAPMPGVHQWISWHPTEVDLQSFAASVRQRHDAGEPITVGAVAVPDHLEKIEALRRELPPEVPMWLNAERPGVRYDAVATERWSQIDPFFPREVRPHRSRGRSCATGEEVLSVEGDGTIRRCRFVPEILGNLYTDDLRAVLGPRPCPRARCDCYVGYSNLREPA